jgi:hypothetical protein
MYEYYFKPIKTGKSVNLDVVFFEDKIENSELFSKDALYIKYNHKTFLIIPLKIFIKYYWRKYKIIL